jgi:flagellar L-ring protein precursor FlgH
MSKVNRIQQLLAASSVAALASLTGGCSGLERLRNLGEQPALSAIDNPTAKPGYKPVHMPMPEPQPAVYNDNSLWRSGSRDSSRTSAPIRSAISSP